MQDHQSVKPLQIKKNSVLNSRLLALWLFPKTTSLKPISLKETKWMQGLSKRRSFEYHHSRGNVRYALSNLWNIPALDIPLNTSPGKAPELPDGWGYVSFSHCHDALLIGWSQTKIGVDIERQDRDFACKKLVNRYFKSNEFSYFKKLPEKELKNSILKQWVIREAAIKWQRGKIGSDFSKWQYERNSNFIYHHTLGYKIKIHHFIYSSWSIAIALDEQSSISFPIICLNQLYKDN